MWLAADKLTLNMTKAEFLLMGSKQRLFNFTANLTSTTSHFSIKQVSTVEFLGVHINENLSWQLSKKIASGISAIARFRYSVPY